MNENNLPVDDASILEELRVIGNDVTEINRQVNEMTGLRDAKMERVRLLYQLYSTRSLTVASVAGEIMEQNPLTPKVDRRREHNPIKNINIGVNLSFRHSKANGYDAVDALHRATESIVETAIGKGLHSKHCTCKGNTYNCPETQFLVTDSESLPDAVSKKLMECFDNYGTKKKKASRKQKTMTA